MAFHLGVIIGGAAVLFLLLAIVLAIGKAPGLRKHPLTMYVVAVILVWIISGCASIQAPEFPVSAYLMTLAAIWSYRRDAKKPRSGWYRLGAGVTMLWLGLGFLVWRLYSQDTVDPLTILAMTWTFVGFGLSPWIFGWLFQWIREGFIHNTKPTDG